MGKGPAVVIRGADCHKHSFPLLVYIVVMRDGESGAASARRTNVPAKYVYSAAINGYSAVLSKAQLAKVRKDAAVKYVEPDSVATISSKARPAPDPSLETKRPSSLKPLSQGVTTETTQTGAIWGIDRIDQRTGTNGAYNYTKTGSGVTAYVIDIPTPSSVAAPPLAMTPSAMGATGRSATVTAPTCQAPSAAPPTAWRRASGCGVRVLDCSGSGAFSGVIAVD